MRLSNTLKNRLEKLVQKRWSVKKYGGIEGFHRVLDRFKKLTIAIQKYNGESFEACEAYVWQAYCDFKEKQELEQQG